MKNIYVMVVVKPEIVTAEHMEESVVVRRKLMETELKLDLTEDEFKMLHIMYLEGLIFGMQAGRKLTDLHTGLMGKFTALDEVLNEKYDCKLCMYSGDCNNNCETITGN